MGRPSDKDEERPCVAMKVRTMNGMCYNACNGMRARGNKVGDKVWYIRRGLPVPRNLLLLLQYVTNRNSPAASSSLLPFP